MRGRPSIAQSPSRSKAPPKMSRARSFCGVAVRVLVDRKVARHRRAFADHGIDLHLAAMQFYERPLQRAHPLCPSRTARATTERTSNRQGPARGCGEPLEWLSNQSNTLSLTSEG